MIIDDINISVAAGNGGPGNASFNRNMMSLGPAGGNGGRGGSVYLEGIANLGALEQFRFKKELEADNGTPGRAQFVDGPDGVDLIAKVPIGTVIHNLTTGSSREILAVGEQVLVAAGGNGGRGNYHFRSATNTSPRQFQSGLPGEKFDLRLELKLIADIGLIGLPNVGKSTFLNLVTKAKSKVANYPFTTLEPNLGVYHHLILADIPGLIEGASQGKGLGIKFLRHIERTNMLFHFIAADSPDIEADYRTIRAELTAYNPVLATKTEYLIISKTDTISPAELKTLLKKAKKLNAAIFPLSMYDDESLAPISTILTDLSNKK